MAFASKNQPPLFRAFTAFSIAWLAMLGACARSQYRKAADHESYCLIDSRQTDPRWDVPNRPVEPQSSSRMYVTAEQDGGPKPIDDAAAKRYMDHPKCIDNTGYYSKIPTRAGDENPIWIDYLPRNADDKIELTQTLANDLALLHSRDYQTEFERVYLTALNLSGNRFEFDTQWVGGLGAGFSASGSDLNNDRSLQVTSSRLGFERNLAGGGQFATNILNSLFWDFGTGKVDGGSAALVTSFTQPLLRGAFRHVRLEDLTQAERNLLYSVRNFARFRRLFYVDVTSNYLDLLTQAQAIRNTRTNVENLHQNLIEHEFYAELEIVSQVQVDQVFQQYQNGRLLLLGAEQQLITSQDEFKFQLGLPSWVPFEVDESLLAPFELVDPRLEDLEKKAQTLFEALVQYLPPTKAPKEMLRASYLEYAALRAAVADILPTVQDELARWQQRLDSTVTTEFTRDDRLDFDQQIALAGHIQNGLDLLNATFSERAESDQEVLDKLEAYEAESPPDAATEEPTKTLAEVLNTIELQDITLKDILPGKKDDPSSVAWEALEQAIGRRLREEIAELYVAQTQIRLFLIDIEPQAIRERSAITYAHQNRLDLMNSKALVMDAFRKVEVAADALQSDLSVAGRVALGSDPTKNNAYRFDSSSNRYTVGVEFDGPLNRLNERNAYRATQIAYQRINREFIADKDRIANDVRSVLRQLELRRLNFQISRQQVVAATRQVDQAQIDLRRSSQADANLTLILLQALQGMLNAKNNLIFNWIQYRVQKMRLFTALEMLYLDENGRWLNEGTGLTDLDAFELVDSEYFPSDWAAPSVPNDVEADGQEASTQEASTVESEPIPAPAPFETLPQVRPGIVVPSPPLSL